MIESMWAGAPTRTAGPSEAARGSEHLFPSRYRSSDLQSQDWRPLMLLFVSGSSRERSAPPGPASAALADCSGAENLWLAENNKYPWEAGRWTFTASRAGEGGICQTSQRWGARRSSSGIKAAGILTHITSPRGVCVRRRAAFHSRLAPPAKATALSDVWITAGR